MLVMGVTSCSAPIRSRPKGGGEYADQRDSKTGPVSDFKNNEEVGRVSRLGRNEVVKKKESQGRREKKLCVGAIVKQEGE